MKYVFLSLLILCPVLFFTLRNCHRTTAPISPVVEPTSSQMTGEADVIKNDVSNDNQVIAKEIDEFKRIPPPPPPEINEENIAELEGTISEIEDIIDNTPLIGDLSKQLADPSLSEEAKDVMVQDFILKLEEDPDMANEVLANLQALTPVTERLRDHSMREYQRELDANPNLTPEERAARMAEREQLMNDLFDESTY